MIFVMIFIGVSLVSVVIRMIVILRRMDVELFSREKKLIRNDFDRFLLEKPLIIFGYDDVEAPVCFIVCLFFLIRIVNHKQNDVNQAKSLFQDCCEEGLSIYQLVSQFKHLLFRLKCSNYKEKLSWYLFTHATL